MNGTELSTKTINYGIALLKVWLSFVVVTCHFYEGTGLLAYPMKVAVPCFIAVSFFFVEASFLKSRKNITVNKFVRLLIPGLFWGGVYYIASLGMHLGASVKDLTYQLLFGGDHLINPTLWYLYDTAIILLLFAALQKVHKKAYTYIRVGLMVLCLSLQYTEINYHLFSKFSTDIGYPLGRLIEMIPAACMGSLLCDVFQNRKALSTLSVGRGIPMLLIGNLLYWGSYYIPRMEIDGFGYHGLIILVGVALLLVAFCGLQIPDKIKRPVMFIQQYGLGIYCIHMAVGKATELLAQKMGIVTGSLISCFIIWLICIVSCVVIDMLTKKKARFLIS